MDTDRKIRDLERRLSKMASCFATLEEELRCFNQWQIVVELGEYGSQTVSGAGVPPIGTRFEAHKHVTDGGTYATFEVTGHQWCLTDTIPFPDGQTRTGFDVKVQTKRCD